MKTFYTLFKKELIEQLRSKKIFVMAILFLFVAIASPVIAKAMPAIFKGLNLQQQGINISIPDPTYRDAIDQFVKNLTQIAILAVVFIFAGSISEEKNKKTLEILLTKPVSRPVFIMSKILSGFLSLSIIYWIGAVIFIFYTKSVLGGFVIANFLELALLLWIYTLLITVIVIFASAVAASTISAVAIGFAGMIIFGSITSMVHLTEKYSPGFVLTNYKDIVADGFSRSFMAPSIVSLVLITIFIVLSVLSFKNQEIER